MLKHLIIRNYALIRDLEISPSSRLNIITGETGAGKSIMLGAVGLLLGNRADTKVLLSGDEKCIVEGVFNLSQYQLKPLFDALDIDYENESIIRREISPTGKSRAFINDIPTTLESLKEVGRNLMDIHSQYDTLQLATNEYQLSVLDQYGQNQELLIRYEEDYKDYRAKKKAYEKLLEASENIKKDADYNQFLLGELQTAKLEETEQEVLEEESRRLTNVEDIKSRFSEILELIDRSDFAALAQIYQSNARLQSIASYSDAYQKLQQRLESTHIELKDIVSELEAESERLEIDPARLQEIQDRLDLIFQLQQKHKVSTIEELLSTQRELEAKVSATENLEDELKAAEKAASQIEKKAKTSAELLTKSREEAIVPFIDSLMDRLKELEMPNASINIRIESTPLSTNGQDKVEILFSANKGIPSQPLKKVASGGEFSRLMFCIKYLLAGKTALPTVVFDEIDAGISGEVAHKMVGMMKKMSVNHQIVTISHLPQFAAKGDAHFFVYKDESTEKSISKIKKLSHEERVLEIAKMIGGDAPSDIAYANAKELMEL